MSLRRGRRNISFPGQGDYPVHGEYPAEGLHWREALDWAYDNIDQAREAMEQYLAKWGIDRYLIVDQDDYPYWSVDDMDDDRVASGHEVPLVIAVRAPDLIHWFETATTGTAVQDAWEELGDMLERRGLEWSQRDDTWITIWPYKDFAPGGPFKPRERKT